jgi:hypothetical protein
VCSASSLSPFTLHCLCAYVSSARVLPLRAWCGSGGALPRYPRACVRHSSTSLTPTPTHPLSAWRASPMCRST